MCASKSNCRKLGPTLSRRNDTTLARVLLFLIIAFLVYMVVRQLLRAQTKKPPEDAAAGPAGEDMVACARCGVNVPRSETREVDGRLICAANPNCK